jgi:hypothetical protein
MNGHELIPQLLLSLVETTLIMRVCACMTNEVMFLVPSQLHIMYNVIPG